MSIKTKIMSTLNLVATGRKFSALIDTGLNITYNEVHFLTKNAKILERYTDHDE